MATVFFHDFQRITLAGNMAEINQPENAKILHQLGAEIQSDEDLVFLLEQKGKRKGQT